MKIIFLDFDGVVVCLPLVDGKKPITGGRVRDANRGPVAQLNRIIDATGAKVVVSSTWRKHHPIPHLLGTLARAGFRGEIVSITPDFAFRDKQESGIWQPTPRGEEIRHWLAMHPAVTSYVVLDDCFDNGPIPPERWVNVDNGWFDGGLLEHHADAAIKVLNGAAE